MKKIRIAQIGTSRYSHGNEIFNAIKSLSDIFEVVGYALPEGEREKFPEKMSAFEKSREMTLDEILNDSTIDAVTVETEEKYLTKYSRLAAEHNKHIHMEKPGGTDLKDFEELTAAVKSKNTVLHIGYMYRYNPVIRRVIKAAQEGKYGKIISVDAQMSCIQTEDMRRWLKDLKGGMMFFLGCHLVDLVLRIKGSPSNVLPLNKSTRTGDVDSKDFGLAVLEYDTGASVVKTSAVEFGGFARRNLVITGDKKTVEIRPLEMYAESGYPNLFTEITEYSSSEWGDTGIHSKSETYDRYLPMMKAFGKMAAGEIKNPFSLDYELELYKTILKCCAK